MATFPPFLIILFHGKKSKIKTKERPGADALLHDSSAAYEANPVCFVIAWQQILQTS